MRFFGKMVASHFRERLIRPDADTGINSEFTHNRLLNAFGNCKRITEQPPASGHVEKLLIDGVGFYKIGIPFKQFGNHDGYINIPLHPRTDNNGVGTFGLRFPQPFGIFTPYRLASGQAASTTPLRLSGSPETITGRLLR